MNSNLKGDFTYMTVMPKTTHILVVATGYPVVKWPTNAGVGPIIPTNTNLRMVLSDDWKTGTANFSFTDNDGKWHEVNDAPATLITCFE